MSEKTPMSVEVESSQHLLSLVSHVLLHFISENTEGTTITPSTFDPRKPEHREFVVNQFGKAVDEIGVAMTNFEARVKVAGYDLKGFPIPGNNTVN